MKSLMLLSHLRSWLILE